MKIILRPQGVKTKLPKRSPKDSQLWAWPKSNRPEERGSLTQFYFSCFRVSVLPPEGALRRPLNTEDRFRSLQFWKHTKFINIWLRNDQYLQSHKATTTDARTATQVSVPIPGRAVERCWYQVGHHRGRNMWERTFDFFSTRHPNLHRGLWFHREWNILEASWSYPPPPFQQIIQGVFVSKGILRSISLKNQ